MQQVGVSKNSGTPKSSILIGFSNINHPFWGTPIFGNTQVISYTTGVGWGSLGLGVIFFFLGGDEQLVTS